MPGGMSPAQGLTWGESPLLGGPEMQKVMNTADVILQQTQCLVIAAWATGWYGGVPRIPSMGIPVHSECLRHICPADWDIHNQAPFRQSGAATHKEYMRVAVFASAQGTAAALDMSFMLDSTHTSQTEDGRIIARNAPLPPPANMTGDRGCPLNYSDWPYETVFKHGNHLRIVDAAFILREQRLCEALGVRR